MAGISPKTYSMWNGWNPPGMIWIPCGMWGESKDLVNWLSCLSFDFCVYKPPTLSSLFMPCQNNKSGTFFVSCPLTAMKADLCVSEMQISSQEKNQKAYDLEIAAAEYRSALEIYHRVEEQSAYNPNIPDPSLFLARLQCQAAENTLTMVQKHYEQLEANASGQVVGTVPPSSPTEIDYFAYFESLPLTPVDGHAGTLQDGLPSPPTYASLENVPSTPTPGQAPLVPSTPTRQGTQPHIAPTSPSQPRTAPTSSFQPRGIPSTPTRFNTTFNISSPQTPNCKKKHYSIVVGRRTGIYSSWYDFYIPPSVLI